MILFTSSKDFPRLRGRLNELPSLPRGKYFEYRLINDSILGIDDSQEILTEYEPDELANIEERISEFTALLVEYAGISDRDAFLRYAIPGLRGVVDTNYDSYPAYEETLTWMESNPGQHFRDWKFNRGLAG